MWYQLDWAPPHYGIHVHRPLKIAFEHQWVGRVGPIHCPDKLPDLSCMDFFVWDHKKSLVYERGISLVEDLIARIFVATGRMRDMPGVFRT
ncbi:uncharacterized protein TNCV_889401 [Trichonephila clavipes]|nr:uncharacterized protein TNCV_889401 [Trichonephila clavipes]